MIVNCGFMISTTSNSAIIVFVHWTMLIARESVVQYICIIIEGPLPKTKYEIKSQEIK
jgi:hypothetical protein